MARFGRRFPVPNKHVWTNTVQIPVKQKFIMFSRVDNRFRLKLRPHTQVVINLSIYSRRTGLRVIQTGSMLSPGIYSGGSL